MYITTQGTVAMFVGVAPSRYTTPYVDKAVTQLPQTQYFDYTCLIIVDTAAECNTADLGFL